MPSAHQFSNTQVWKWQISILCHIIGQRSRDVTFSMDGACKLFHFKQVMHALITMFSCQGHYKKGLLLTQPKIIPQAQESRTFICKRLTFFGGKTWGSFCVGWSIVDQQWATCNEKKRSYCSLNVLCQRGNHSAR